MKKRQAEIRENYRKLTEKLIEKKITITSMESCTSGQIASLITDTEGASAILKGAYITYSNEAKIMAGVPGEVIETYSVYSMETANQMALACQKAFGADLAIGVTGNMGNIDPANPEHSNPGQVYFSIAFGEELFSFHISLEVQPDRLSYKLEVAQRVYEELIKIIS